MKSIRLSSPLQTDSVVDGEGLRCVLWTQGCPHHCNGCHNPETHDVAGGEVVDLDALQAQMKEQFYHDGITFSGGEPMLQPEACRELACWAHQLGWNVWCYTGYLWEALISSEDPAIHSFLKEIDVLVDGPFVLEKKTLDCVFRGSFNQRLIDVSASLQQGKLVLFAFDK